MPLPTHNAPSSTDTLKARRAYLANLLTLLDINRKNATEIEKLSTNAIKSMIDALDSQLKKRGI